MKTSGWTKALGTVLGIVLVGFSAATICTLFERTPYASAPDLPEVDLGQKIPLAGDTPNSSLGGIRQARTLRAIAHSVLANDQTLKSPFTHPQSTQFSVEHHLSVDLYHLNSENVWTML